MYLQMYTKRRNQSSYLQFKKDIASPTANNDLKDKNNNCEMGVKVIRLLLKINVIVLAHHMYV